MYYIILITISAITPTDKSVTTAVNQVISCDISGLDAAATVKWLEPDDSPISDGDTTDYVVEQGAGSFNSGDGSQKTTLTILPGKLAALTSPATYKCSVTSGQYASSPASKGHVVVTVLALGKLLKLEQFMSNCF